MASINDNIGNYRIIGELAIGGFGSVYQAEHTLLPNRLVAIKLMHATHLNSQQERDRFLQEAKLLEMLKHPHILPFIIEMASFVYQPLIRHLAATASKRPGTYPSIFSAMLSLAVLVFMVIRVFRASLSATHPPLIRHSSAMR